MLTDTKLRALKPRASAFRIADANGLCIEVRPTGAKTWRYRYRHAGSASIITLGEYPSMSLAEARAERDKARALLRGGANPANVARAQRALQAEHTANTFAAIATEFLAKREKEGMGTGSVTRAHRLIEKDLAGIGNLPITEVTAVTLLAALRKLEHRGVVETAHCPSPSRRLERAVRTLSRTVILLMRPGAENISSTHSKASASASMCASSSGSELTASTIRCRLGER